MASSAATAYIHSQLDLLPEQIQTMLLANPYCESVSLDEIRSIRTQQSATATVTAPTTDKQSTAIAPMQFTANVPEAKPTVNMPAAPEQTLVPDNGNAAQPESNKVADMPEAQADGEHAIDTESATTEHDLINDIKLYVGKGKSFSFILKELHETLQAYPARQPISDARLEELIQQHAPNLVDGRTKALPKPDYPSELEPLIKSGAAFYTNYANGRPNHVMVKWCSVCHNFGKDECCNKPFTPKMAETDGRLTHWGQQALGLEPIEPPKTSEQREQERITSWKDQPWWMTFKGANELDDGPGIRMYVNNFIPEGVTILASLPKEGKTWLALSICKALTSGAPLFGKAGFEVPEIVPVIYLAAEVSERSLKQRIKKFGITDDKEKFLCRTISSIGGAGNMNLTDKYLLEAISATKPIVILDVLQCFSTAEDENDAAENKNLRYMIDSLRARGARAIIVLHHSTKNFKEKPTKENAVRGSGDILAMVDCVWALMLDDRLCQSTNIEEVDCMGWGRDFAPTAFRFALTRKAKQGETETYRNGVVSVLDTEHDLVFVDKAARKASAETALRQTSDYLESLVRKNPAITLKELASRTGQTYSAVQADLKACGWSKPAGRAKKGEEHVWTRSGIADAQAVNEQSVTIN